MAICEKCWADAHLIAQGTGEDQYTVYLRVLKEHKDKPCPNLICPSCDNSMLEGQKLCSSCKDIHRHAMLMMRERGGK
jgi:hypothetical protein